MEFEFRVRATIPEEEVDQLTHEIGDLNGVREIAVRQLPSANGQHSIAGEMLKEIRTEIGISMYRLAVRGGISTATIADLEHGKSIGYITDKSVTKIVEGLRLEAEDPRLHAFLDAFAVERAKINCGNHNGHLPKPR